MIGFRFLGVGGNRSARRKPTKAGMESSNHMHNTEGWVGNLVNHKHIFTRILYQQRHARWQVSMQDEGRKDW